MTKPPMTGEEALAIARQAKVELPQTERAFDGLEAIMLNEAMATDVDQSLKREKLFLAMRTLRMVKKALMRAAREADAADMRNILAAETDLLRP